MNLNYFLQGLLDLVYPPRQTCPLCGSQSPKGKVCDFCLQWLHHYGAGPVCPVCGRFPGKRENSGNLLFLNHPCSFCSARSPAFDLARAVAPYRGALREAILQLKSRGARRVAAALGELMAGVARREPAMARADVIIPVPLSPKRLARRGFNQAHLLAVELGRILDLPVDTRTVVKVKETRPQAGLPKQEREINLVDAFSISYPDKIKGKRVLIVDDVFTTGSTVENISRELRQFHTAKVFVLTAAGGIR